VRAEAGGDEEAVDVGLAEQELVVRGERLRPVDDLPQADIGHSRHPDLGVVRDLLEAVPDLGEEPAVEVRRDGVVRAGGGRPRLRGPLVAAHDEAVDLLPEVDEQVRVAQRRQR
jgi:hypothetical protein